MRDEFIYHVGCAPADTVQMKVWFHNSFSSALRTDGCMAWDQMSYRTVLLPVNTHWICVPACSCQSVPLCVCPYWTALPLSSDHFSVMMLTLADSVLRGKSKWIQIIHKIKKLHEISLPHPFFCGISTFILEKFLLLHQVLVTVCLCLNWQKLMKNRPL